MMKTFLIQATIRNGDNEHVEPTMTCSESLEIATQDFEKHKDWENEYLWYNDEDDKYSQHQWFLHGNGEEVIDSYSISEITEDDAKTLDRLGICGYINLYKGEH